VLRAVLATVFAVLAVAVAFTGSLGAQAFPRLGLTTAVYLLPSAGADDPDLTFKRIKAAGAKAVRISARWDTIAPAKVPEAGSFVASDPGDSHYDWSALDAMVRGAAAQGLQPILSIYGPPTWGQESYPHTYLAVGAPNLDDYTAFATAITKRYSGQFDGLPRVRYWMVWNEPNAIYYWAPQFDDHDRPVSPDKYRAIANAFAKVAHGVHRDNVVIAGSLTPFTTVKPQTMAPFVFMRRVLCMSAGAHPHPTCHKRINFDVWSHHPYTSGGPEHSAASPDDASLGDLREMHDLLNAAVRAGNVVSSQHVQFWVTEFSWDSSPPDPKGVPISLETRWVAQALYEMWRAGVNLVTWLELRDGTYPGDDVQSGLYYRGTTIAADKPKPLLEAFRFPFVASANGTSIRYWGRVPPGASRSVVVQRATSAGWDTVAERHADGYGIFRGAVASTAMTGRMRAVTGKEGSHPFFVGPVPDRSATPFGIGG
jgi:hypothetical protein